MLLYIFFHRTQNIASGNNTEYHKNITRLVFMLEKLSRVSVGYTHGWDPITAMSVG